MNGFWEALLSLARGMDRLSRFGLDLGMVSLSWKLLKQGVGFVFDRVLNSFGMIGDQVRQVV